MKCLRCGDRFELRTADQIHCLRCAAEVAAIVSGDDKRRAPRFPAKDYSGQRGLVL